MNPWSKVSSALSCLVGRFGGKKVHRTFFTSLLTPSSAVPQRTTLLSPRSPRHYHASSVGSEEKRFTEPFFFPPHPIFRGCFLRSTSLSPRAPRHYHASSVGSEEKRFPEPFFLPSSPHLPQFPHVLLH